MGKKKKDGKIFTPEPIVKHMLYNEMWRHHELDSTSLTILVVMERFFVKLLTIIVMYITVTKKMAKEWI